MAATAPDTYAIKHANALALLDTLRGVIEDLPAPDTDGINWGHVGSMEHVNAQLRELIAFTGGDDA